MIYSLNGILTYTGTAFAVIECGGVGYKCLTSTNTLRKLPKSGEKAFLYTHMNVREDAVELFGFADSVELECFRLLISVSGVGPRAALSLLSEMSPDQFALRVAAGDARALTKAQGVGAKTAQRIVLELKDKVSGAQVAKAFASGDVNSVNAPGRVEEAVDALVSLGYSRAEALSAAAKADESLPVEGVVKFALKQLMK